MSQKKEQPTRSISLEDIDKFNVALTKLEIVEDLIHGDAYNYQEKANIILNESVEEMKHFQKCISKWCLILTGENKSAHRLAAVGFLLLCWKNIFDNWKRYRSRFTLKIINFIDLQREVFKFTSVNVANATLRLVRIPLIGDPISLTEISP